MARVCTYVVASRDLLYLLYHSSNWGTPSPLWNLFADPIYLNLPPVEDVDRFLSRASDKAREESSGWNKSDIEYIKKIAGRHPALLRIVCASMFEYRLKESRVLTVSKASVINPISMTQSIALPDRFACNSGKALPDQNYATNSELPTNNKMRRRVFRFINEHCSI